MRKKYWILIALVALVASSLACNPPTPTIIHPTVTPYVPATAVPQDTPPPESPTEVPEATEPPPPTEEGVSSPTEEGVSQPTDTPLPTDTATPVPPTPIPPTSVPSTATTEPAATHTPEAGGLLDFEPPTGVDSWEKKGDTNEVVLRVNIVGGVPPFTVSHGGNVDGTTSDRVYLIKFEWSACKSAMVQSITVESSDGQTITHNYFIPVAAMPWCPTPVP